MTYLFSQELKKIQDSIYTWFYNEYFDYLNDCIIDIHNRIRPCWMGTKTRKKSRYEKK